MSKAHSLRSTACTAIAILAAVLLTICVATMTTSQQTTASKNSQSANDPATWGGNHVGKGIPEFVHGDECLFCHRNDVGITWQKNAHGVTVRQQEDAPELRALIDKQERLATVKNQIEYFLGSRHRIRFLKKDGYGKFDLLSTQAAINPNAQPETWTDL